MTPHPRKSKRIKHTQSSKSKGRDSPVFCFLDTPDLCEMHYPRNELLAGFGFCRARLEPQIRDVVEQVVQQVVDDDLMREADRGHALGPDDGVAHRDQMVIDVG